MGNKLNVHITSGIKEQAAGTTNMYCFTDLKGGGELVELMKKANRTKNYKELDEKIRDELKPYLYNDGKGKMVHIREIVKARCNQRGTERKMKIDISKEKPQKDMLLEELDDQYFSMHGAQYKEVCWKLEERGGVGETPLHVCLLNATSIHADLAKRLLRHYPKLIKDIYISDVYFGENVLHMAIVNEDPAMVKYLLDNGADYNQRATGYFFTADDQKGAIQDSFDHEWFDLPVQTNYHGYVYWGEYPLAFAACLGQEECVRLLLAKGADPNLIDTNGNTVLHLLVIHDKKDMFDLIVALGGQLHIKNRQSLTPLTLAAKLAHKDMYEHILEIEREVYWMYGSVTCAAYPLEHIDTISHSGDININSAMYHVVYGDAPGHLDMMDGMVSQLLTEKWKTFVQFRFLRRFVVFVVYFILFLMVFGLRPGTDLFPTHKQVTRIADNGSEYTVNVTVKDSCYLLRVRSYKDVLRMVLESLVLLGSIIYAFLALKEIYYQGYRIFFHTLMAAPWKGLFLLSNCFVMLLLPGRASCALVYEDIISVLAILTTAPYFLFFCRGFKRVGPFVLMIHKMIRTDLLRFFSIYLIFVIGFSQAMYIVFRGVESNIFNDPMDAVMGMFLMSLGEFGDIYESFTQTRIPNVPKMIFAIYMILVTLLLINMLIAMMGNTYQTVNQTQKEWLRQWAKIILIVEQTVTTAKRRQHQIDYSEAMKDGRRALVIRWYQTQKEKDEQKKKRMAEKLLHQQHQQQMTQRKRSTSTASQQISVTEAKLSQKYT